MIYKHYIPYIDRMLGLIELEGAEWLVIGMHQVKGGGTLDQYLIKRGAGKVVTLDYFDPAANLQLDLNKPTGIKEEFDGLIDIGSIEHIFDTKQVLKNYIEAVRIGGLICIHTPVAGYRNHGFYTFSPEALCGGLRENGCVILSEEYSGGNRAKNEDTNIWIAARKDEAVDRFACPQQSQWKLMYG